MWEYVALQAILGLSLTPPPLEHIVGTTQLTPHTQVNLGGSSGGRNLDRIGDFRAAKSWSVENAT